MGVTGDFILDTATPHTQLAETQAQAAGYATDATLAGEVRLAGMTLPAQAVRVADLDLRTGALPTPVAGVIGADVLQAYVLDVRFSPCRIGLYPAGAAPRFPASAALPLQWVAGRPVVEAEVSDGVGVLKGGFAPGVGDDTPVRLSDAVAAVPGAATPKELYPGGVLRPRLASLAFAGARLQQVPGGLTPAEDAALLGVIGAPLLAHYRLRFDFPAARLLLTPLPPPSR